MDRQRDKQKDRQTGRSVDRQIDNVSNVIMPHMKSLQPTL